MELLHFFAQSTQYYTQSNSELFESSSAAGASAAAGLVVGFAVLIAFILSIGAYIFISICLMKIFKKAGVAPWIAWVPFYNTWKTLEIGGQPGFWAVLGIIPFLNIVTAIYLYIAMYHIGKKLGKGGEFVLWAIFLPYVWYPWLAFDKSTWNDTASTAPSLHTPTAPPSTTQPIV